MSNAISSTAVIATLLTVNDHQCLNDNRKPFFENDRFTDVDSFNLLAGDLEITLGSGET